MSVMHTEMEKNDELRMEWDPFADTPPNGGFFSGAGRGELAEQILYLLRYGSCLSLLAGPAGVGKRNLLVHLLTRIDRDLFDVAVIDGEATTEFSQLLTQLDGPWRSSTPFTVDNYRELVPKVAVAADEESKTLVCILVGVQAVPESVLNSLQSLLTATAGLPVKCMLLVDCAELESVPALQGMMKALPDTAVLYLDPLDRAQTQEYLDYRLQQAGLGQTAFSHEQSDRIFSLSEGVIARINAAARDVLLETAPAAKAAVTRQPLPWKPLAALAAGVVILILLFSGNPDSKEPASVPQMATIEAPVPPLAQLPPAQQPFVEVERLVAESAPAVVPEPDPVMQVSEPAPSQPVAKVPAVEPKAPVAPASTPAPVAAKPAVAAAPKPAAPAPASKAATDNGRANWVRSLPEGHYMLQLLGASEEATVKRFLNNHPSLRKVTYYKTWRQGKPWYVVVQGDYPTHDAAKAAIGTLPASLQAQKPWIKKVDVIKKEMPAR